MRAAGWLIVVATVFTSGPIRAQRPALPCVDRESPRLNCGPAEERRLLDLYGLKSIVAHREAGDEVRRAFYDDGFGNDVFAISFVRAKGREPQVSVAFPRRPGEAPWTMSAAVSERTWNDVLARSHLFDRALAPLPPSPDGSGVVCIDPPSALVESTDVAGDPVDSGVRRQYGSSCTDYELALSYALELVKATGPLFTFCQSLAPGMSQWSILEQCGRLRGDRMAAAAVMNLADEFSLTIAKMRSNYIPATPEALGFSAEAAIEWAGERSEPGQAAEFWLAHAGPGQYVHIDVDLVTAESQADARVVGRLTHSSKSAGEMVFEVAPIEMRWARDRLVGMFLLERVTVGAFKPEPER